MPETYITLEDAAKFEGIQYKGMTSRIERNPEQYKTKPEIAPDGGKPRILIAVSCLSKNARYVYKESQLVLGLDKLADGPFDTSSPPWYVEYDPIEYKNKYCGSYEPPDNVYGILAAPPCTEFSVAKGGRPRDFKSAMEVVEACMRIIWKCRLSGNLKFWALENPVGYLRQFLGIPKYTFEQWQFGEERVKRTDVWGYFNEPTPTVKRRPDNVSTCIGHRTHSMEWSKAETPKGYEYLNKLPYDERRAAIRAITPPGFAKAFYKANT